MKPANPVRAWAVVVRSQRSEWIDWGTIGRTRAGSWAQFRDNFLESARPELEKQRRAGRYRLARVTIALEEQR